MQIIPGLYLQDERLVSWYKGKENKQKKVYRYDPVEIAAQFEKGGAQMLHIVDLSRHKNGSMANDEVLDTIRKRLFIPIQIGGGIYTEEAVQNFIDRGFNRVMVGYGAWKILPRLLEKFGSDRIVFGIKGRDTGVESDHDVPEHLNEVAELGMEAAKLGVKHIVYKDLDAEGTTKQPNYDEADKLIGKTKVNIYVAGGITTAREIDIFRKINAAGVIVSRALIEGMLKL